jgi:hypothetical protein
MIFVGASEREKELLKPGTGYCSKINNGLFDFCVAAASENKRLTLFF